MLRRKIEDELLEWKRSEDRKPVIISGLYGCGKTTSALAFAHKHYRHVVYPNFAEDKRLSSVFKGSLEVDEIIKLLSAYKGLNAQFESGHTVLIFDEINDCPQARTALKFLHKDGRYDVIATASCLKAIGYAEDPVSIPVGSEHKIDMHPLDFEEFLHACGIDESITAMLKDCLENETRVPEALHGIMHRHLCTYAAVGGMPEAVELYLKTKNMQQVLKLQRKLIRTYEDLMVKLSPQGETIRIRQCFECVPAQLQKSNPKFQYALLGTGGAERYLGSLIRLEDAGLIRRCRNLGALELPLDGNACERTFKVYYADCAFMTALCEDGTQFELLQGNLHCRQDLILESLMADIFGKMGRKLHYFRKASGLTIDFVIRCRGQCVPLEIKAVNGNAKALKTVLNDPRYKIGRAIKLWDYNLESTPQVLKLPYYLAFLLKGY